MRLVLAILFVLLTIACAAESALGGIKLGEDYQTVLIKYPDFDVWHKLEATTKPYPLTMSNQERVFLAQSSRLDIQCYFNQDKKVTAIVAYFYEKEDESNYDTSAGLRPGDEIEEMKLLYGEPNATSEYSYVDEDKAYVTRKIYYYPDLCIHTAQYDDNREYIDSIVLGEYSLGKVMAEKDKELSRKNL